MATLSEDIAIDETDWLVSADIPDTIDYLTVESEVVQVTATFPAQYQRGEGTTSASRIRVIRGAGGTTAATHSSGTSLTPLIPPSSSGGGGAGLTLDNQSDPPTIITSLVSAGATIVGSEGTLPWQTPEGTLLMSLPSDVSNTAIKVDIGGTEVFAASQLGLQVHLGDPDLVGSGYVLKGYVPENQVGPRLQIEGDDDSGSVFDLGHAGGLQIVPRADVTHVLDIFDAAGNRAFTVDADGTVHIKTGTSIVADL